MVQGGKPIKGEVQVRGAKNSGFKLMMAALMGKTPSLLSNIAKAGETKISFSVIKQLGGKLEFVGEHSLRVDPKNIDNWVFPFGLGKESRASTLFVPSLLFHFGEAKVPWPGGDKIGGRPLERHFEGIKKMGVEIIFEDEWISFKMKSRPKGCFYRFDKNTHTGTDTLLMLASFAEGETILENAAEEPEVDDLIEFLNKMGAKIKRVGPRTIVIRGVEKFNGAQHVVMPDRNEAVTFACAALGTRGNISIFNVRPKDLVAFVDKVKEAGGKIEIGVNEMKVEGGNLRATKVETSPHPGFMTDWQTLWFTLMTQARGKSTVIERVHLNRFQFASQLQKMGARIKYFNPVIANPDEYYNFNPEEDRPDYYHGAFIWGPVKLRGTEVDAADLRAGAAMLLAALMAEGETTISNAEELFRGYENLDTRLSNLGGEILRIKNNH